MKKTRFPGILSPVLALLSGLLLATGLAQAAPAVAIIRVSPTGTTSWPCGGSWNTPCTLDTALTHAASGDEIWVARGIYTPTQGITRTASFQLKADVAIYGGFAMTETLRNQRNWTRNVVTLSGDRLGNDGPNFANYSDNSYHVITGTTGATLDGVTITGGNANGDYPHDSGGGILNSYSNFTLTHVILVANSASYFGGGISNYEGNLILIDVTFNNNYASSRGGGMYSRTSQLTLNRVSFNNNSSGDQGGGMFNSFDHSTLTDITFNSNIAGNEGGGMYNLNNTPILSNVTIISNSASLHGGGMYNFGSRPAITNAVFIGNHTGPDGDGGGMCNGSYSGPALTAVTFISNSALNGAGISSYNSSAVLLNVTFINNQASGIGGGMLNNFHSSPVLSHTTFSNNSGSSLYNIFYSTPQVNNSIFWGNNGGEIFNGTEYGAMATISNSVVQGGYPGGVNIITADPRFGPLGTYGGPAPTLPLLPGSAAINGTSTNCPATDQRGVTRGTTCDIGAYETRDFILTHHTGTGQFALLDQPFLRPLQVTVTSAYADPVDGGIVTFTGPFTGAGIVPITTVATISNGLAATGIITANHTIGTYTVTASTTGAPDALPFILKNLESIISLYVPITQHK